MLTPLEIRPGIVRIGTDYQSRGSWYDANLIRFYEQSIRPVGGWIRLADADPEYDGGEVPRAMHAWRSFDGLGRLIIGTSTTVFTIDSNGVRRNLTPIVLGTPPDPEPPTYVPRAYGSGFYGSGFYGKNKPVVVLPPLPPGINRPLVTDEQALWSFDNFGETPVGVLSSDKKIRAWDLTDTGTMDVVSDFAPDCSAVVVTAERYLMALGASTRARGELVFAGNVQEGDTVTIGDITYTFMDSVSTTEYEVQIGSSMEETIANLVAAINQSGVGGSQYGSLTAFHPLVRAKANTLTSTVRVVARVTGEDGNGIPLLTNMEYDGTAVWSTPVTHGGSGNPAAVAWATRETTDDWIPDETNTAGEFAITTSGRILAGRRMPRETLIWTDTDLHAAVYIGGNLIYGFEARGDKCGSISQGGIAVVGDVAYWMSDNGFYRYDGAVTKLPCQVQDYVFGHLNRQAARIVCAVPISQYSEVWWFYPADGSEEISRYVSYNYRENHWSIGSLVRTCGVDRGVFVHPVLAASDGTIWAHEVGTERPGSDPIYLASGPIEIEEGNNVWMVRSVVPDERNLGRVHVYVASTFFPTDSATFVGPLIPTQPSMVRLTGRSLQFRLQEALPDSDFRVGRFRVDAVACGER